MSTPATQSPAQQVFFYKELVSNPIMINGARVPFEQLDGNRGVIALTPGKDDALIVALNGFATQSKFGVVKISEDDFNKKKLAHPLTRSAQRRPDMLQIRQFAVAPIFKPQLPEERTPADPAVAGAKPNGEGFTPLNVPTPAKMPTPPTPPEPPLGTEMKSNFKPNTARPSERKKGDQQPELAASE